ncbi:MAG: hypothetical protein HDR11_06840 [Lachnospiraceae bacterium]|nr:hypothetical protein [Lachnospiraceae bacterium]
MRNRNFKITATMGLLAAHTAASMVSVLSGGNEMDMSMLETVKTAVDIGITPVLLIVLVIFFLSRNKQDTEQMEKIQSESQKTIKEAFETAHGKVEEAAKINKERIEAILEENAKREELLRKAAEEREELIRRDSEKRESILLTNMERMVDSMGEINRSMKSIEASFTIMERRLEKIENRMG